MGRWSRRQIVGALGVLPILTQVHHVSAQAAEEEFKRIRKTLWVWKDRILAPDDLDPFCRSYEIGTLFLYTTPTAADALLSGDRIVSDNMARLRADGRKIYAMAGEPDWALGLGKVPEHADLLIRLQALSPPLFHGIHFDVEPNALPEWRELAKRQRLIDGTVRFYDLIRKAAPDATVDAAVNPAFAGMRTSQGDHFLPAVAQRVRSMSLMAYRNRVQPALHWAAPALRQFNATESEFRFGVETNDNPEEPTTSWSRVPRPQFLAAMVALDRTLSAGPSARHYAGLALHSFDGLKALLNP